MKNKSKKNIDRDQSLEIFYQGYNEFNEYNHYNQINKNSGSYGQRKFMERRINEQKFGMFGNALITFGMIAVIIAILYFFVF